MRWLGACIRAQEIATAYAVKRRAFGQLLIEHEGVGFMLAENQIDLKQAELMIDWCAGVLDSGAKGIGESSMAKVAVSEALFRVADRCVQVMGGTGLTGDTIVEKVFPGDTRISSVRRAHRSAQMVARQQDQKECSG
jgi:acyl-CoA dehydrogenase